MTKRKSKRRKRRRRLNFKGKLLLTALVLIFAAIIVLIVVLANKGSGNEDEEAAALLPIELADGEAQVVKFYSYGLNFNIFGTISVGDTDVEEAYLVFVDVSTGEEKYSEPLEIFSTDGTLVFGLSDEINTGMPLENFDDGNYMVFIKLASESFADDTEQSAGSEAETETAAEDSSDDSDTDSIYPTRLEGSDSPFKEEETETEEENTATGSEEEAVVLETRLYAISMAEDVSEDTVLIDTESSGIVLTDEQTALLDAAAPEGSAGLAAIEYYTLTSNGSNQKIDIDFATTLYLEDSIYTLTFNVAQAELPEDVYDIVIDPGHGGYDSGATTEDGETEAENTLAVALELYEYLTDAGYKVKLTRNGVDETDDLLPSGSYNVPGGRVTQIGASGAKIAISVHFNSDASEEMQGIQVYSSNRGSCTLAKLIADSVVEVADTVYSSQSYYEVEEGAYQRAFTAAEVAESIADAEAEGYEPYNWTTDTDYYYMIRDTGGLVTNALSDGRVEGYNENIYRDSNCVPETVLMEGGYMSNPEDLANFSQNPDKYAQGVYEAILAYIGSFTESETTEEDTVETSSES